MNLLCTVVSLVTLWTVKAQAKSDDLQGQRNRLSFRAGHIVGFLNTNKFPLAVNYERMLGYNISLGGSIGHMVIPADDVHGYHLAQISLRRFFFGEHQRLALGMHAFFRYFGRYDPELTSAAAFEVGYFWQWESIFISLEGGLGPGVVGKRDSGRYRLRADIVDASLNLGVPF